MAIWPPSRTSPGLTTVHQPVEEILGLATRLLIAILKGGTKGDRDQIIVPSQLVIRGSSGYPPERPALPAVVHNRES